MQPLIKITTEPIRIMRFSQNARLVNADSVDMERRKAIARHMSMQKSSVQGSVSVENLTKINRTFSTHTNVTPQIQGDTFQQVNRQAAQISAQMSLPPKTASVPASSNSIANFNSGDMAAAVDSNVSNITAMASNPVSAPAVSQNQNISVETNASYAMQRGAFEMRVAKGELTYLPPLTMTIITQRPQVHIEYLGGYNYVPPLDSGSGGSINLFT
ncbi:MAG: hypothetical protein HFG49_09075 [Lachnospiraceae bacterium]|jgi:hypothetical protein|nr:hypothetical protein [Lachnospiraceae bacterium]